MRLAIVSFRRRFTLREPISASQNIWRDIRDGVIDNICDCDMKKRPSRVPTPRLHISITNVGSKWLQTGCGGTLMIFLKSTLTWTTIMSMDNAEALWHSTEEAKYITLNVCTPGGHVTFKRCVYGLCMDPAQTTAPPFRTQSTQTSRNSHTHTQHAA